MKMHRIQHPPTSVVPVLLSLWLALTASAGTNDTAAPFASVVPFELGDAEFLPGDSITIQQVRGTSATIRTGETYCVEGTYTLASRDKADLAFFATTSSSIATPTDPSQVVRIEKGSGAFRLVKTMREDGYLHVSFYPVPGGSVLGGVYFGQGNGVLRYKGWHSHGESARGHDYSTTGASTGRPVSLTGPNQTLLEYLGDPVSPPADLDPAYSKDGLIKAIQTAARKAGISVQRVEIDDTEFPFLVGVTCRAGDYAKLTEQLRKMAGYAYNGCISDSTHAAMNLVPYRVLPPGGEERINHRCGLREQVLFDKLTRQE